ncbi:hypothetical protein DFJ58DRAFT_731389 [Suillus subalutaceus]|uniref:uncharacterized protein n=1 Tax=Suillus subalutaceus TaxID=48586 RepID=UPI001B85E9B6|nr:uncharacterized protein DFJ58DRAFT_731389 [Suillus subalutaceus]KAG1844084.1 hypothetical protein DFJ58DRAFT_731389 [Suillus subalutaceus]
MESLQRECLTQTKRSQLHVDAELHKDLTMLDIPDVLHEYFCQSVNPNNGELVHEATNVRWSCAVIDLNDGDVMMLQEMFEHRLRYRLVFKDVVVDSTWFSSTREYLTCIMHNLEAYRFAERVAQVLHKDIMPSNLWIVIDNASAEAAVPGWVGNDPPLPRQAQLGNFGLGFKPSDSCKFAKLLTEKPAKTCRIETGDGGGTGGLMRAGNATIKKERAAKLKDKPSQAMDRSGSPLYMSNETLADPFGQFIVHTSKHDLEGFWWSMLWVTINCEGPYNCLASLGNWRFYQCLIHPFWHDPAIPHGLEEMFHIFMPANLIRESYETLDAERDFVPYVPLDDSAVGATHEMMINIIKHMLKDMKDEAPPSPKVIEDARERYQARLRHDFTNDDAEEIRTRQERSASRESCQSQNNRRPGLMIPPGVPGSQSSPPPTFGIFHSSGSPDSPHFLAEDLASLPRASAASRAMKSFNMSSTPLAQVTGKRPYLGTYTPKPGRSSAVSAPSPAVDSVDRVRLRTDTTMSLPSSSTSTSTSSRVPTQPSDTQRLQYHISQTILGPDFFHGLPSLISMAPLPPVLSIPLFPPYMRMKMVMKTIGPGRNRAGKVFDIHMFLQHNNLLFLGIFHILVQLPVVNAFRLNKVAIIISVLPDPALEDELEPEDVLGDLYQEMFDLVPAQLDDNYYYDDGDVNTEPIAGPGPSSRHGLLEDEDDNRVEVVHLTAGKVIRMDSTLHERWQKQFGVQKKNEEEEQAIPGVQERLGLSYHNTRALHKSLDVIPPRAEWHSKKLAFEDRPNDEYNKYYRNPIDAIQSLLGNPVHAKDIVYRPKKIFRDHTKSVRIYNEMWSGKWWHAIQNRLPVGAALAPVIIATDKTQLTQFSSSKSAYPIYLTLGNIPRAIRRKPSQQACFLLGYLSVDKILKDDLSSREVSSRAQRLFHDSLRIILEPLKLAGAEGVEITGGDGCVRLIFPVLACYVADYPEQCLVTCSKYGTCPKCQARTDELAELSQSTVQTQTWTMGIIEEAKSSTNTSSAFKTNAWKLGSEEESFYPSGMVSLTAIFIIL